MLTALPRCSSRDTVTSTMPKLLDLAREIRDMIYEKALYTENILYVYTEPSNFIYFGTTMGKPRVSLPLLTVSKQLHHEAGPIFYAVNTFCLPRDMPYQRPSAFLNDPMAFHQIVTELLFRDIGGFVGWDVQRDHNLNAWHGQLQPLTAMVNLQRLQLDVSGFLEFARRHTKVQKYSHDDTSDLQSEIQAYDFFSALLEHLPHSVRNKQGDASCGIWIKGDFRDETIQGVSDISNEDIPSELQLLGEAGRRFGLNFMQNEEKIMLRDGYSEFPTTKISFPASSSATGQKKVSESQSIPVDSKPLDPP